MATVTYVHFGVNETELGIHFSADDGAGGMVEGHAYAACDPALKDAVLKAAQAALDALTGDLPANYPPGAVTTALMKARDARQEAAKALAAQRDAEEKRAAAERAVADKRAELEALNHQIRNAEEKRAAAEEPSS